MKVMDICDKHGISNPTVYKIRREEGVGPISKPKESKPKEKQLPPTMLTNQEKLQKLVDDGLTDEMVYNQMHDHMTDEQIREALEACNRNK